MPTFRAAAVARLAKVLVLWEPVPQARAYSVERMDDDNGWEEVATCAGPGARDLLDTTVQPGITYRYRVVTDTGLVSVEAEATPHR